MSELPPPTDDAVPMTDDELAQIDLPSLLESGLTDVERGAQRRALFGEGAVCAAIILDRLDVLPRSVSFLAEVARAGGSAFAAELAEPLPDPAASLVVLDWLHVASDAGADGEDLARWLEAVAVVVDLRRRTRAPLPGAG